MRTQGKTSANLRFYLNVHIPRAIFVSINSYHLPAHPMANGTVGIMVKCVHTGKIVNIKAEPNTKGLELAKKLKIPH